MERAAGQVAGEVTVDEIGRQHAIGAAAAGGDQDCSRGLARPNAHSAAPPQVASRPQAALSAAEAAVDTALARIDGTIQLLDALGDLAESYFEAIVATHAVGASPDAVRDAAHEHAVLVLHLLAGEATSWFGEGRGGFDAAGTAGNATSQLVQALVGPLTADDSETAAAGRKAVDDVAYAAYGLTQARIRLTAAQQRIARAGAALRGERRELDAGSLAASSATFATLADVLRMRSVAAAGGGAGAGARAAGRPQRA